MHRCVTGALDMAGLGAAALRKIAVDAECRTDIAVLEAAIARDVAAGATPFLIVGTAGAVDTGAIDDFTELHRIAAAHGAWLHADAAFGALAALSPTHAPKLRGIEHADSVAFDFHKWAQVTYDAGCLLVRDPAIQYATFAQKTGYLAGASRGLAGGAPWPCDLGPDLSRGFRALKIWMTLSAYGTGQLGGVVDTTCALAQRLAARVEKSAALRLCAPVNLNIVCFAVEGFNDEQTEALVADLQEEGLFAPSTTRIGGRLCIRAAIVNHRTNAQDIDDFVAEILRRA
ncbi:MAG: hypothetical protein B7Z80_23905 [Rhodospirillales bacterium 20-64-7]|nr:MAG: hypothetical protein B7Z80_23905 [Rhodospirillales bacterium 20-64-7]